MKTQLTNLNILELGFFRISLSSVNCTLVVSLSRRRIHTRLYAYKSVVWEIWTDGNGFVELTAFRNGAAQAFYSPSGNLGSLDRRSTPPRHSKPCNCVGTITINGGQQQQVGQVGVTITRIKLSAPISQLWASIGIAVVLPSRFTSFDLFRLERQLLLSIYSRLYAICTQFPSFWLQQAQAQDEAIF